ncbi:MAG TPA: hypothetical protein PLF78_03605 [Caulobacter sp.]|nr:hypothetical protein [Caulobacter sp.]
MRLPALLSATVFAAAIASTAQAAPARVATINIDIGPELAGKTDIIGQRDLDQLTDELRESLERELGRAGALTADGGVLTVVIEDATPNRPTMRQLTRTPGLSYESRGIGGATLSGTYVGVDGVSTPISYRWYESDFRNTVVSATWSDAERTFDRFARKLARGESVAAK